jgi:hypothetical protein
MHSKALLLYTLMGSALASPWSFFEKRSDDVSPRSPYHPPYFGPPGYKRPSQPGPSSAYIGESAATSIPSSTAVHPSGTGYYPSSGSGTGYSPSSGAPYPTGTGPSSHSYQGTGTGSAPTCTDDILTWVTETMYPVTQTLTTDASLVYLATSLATSTITVTSVLSTCGDNITPTPAPTPEPAAPPADNCAEGAFAQVITSTGTATVTATITAQELLSKSVGNNHGTVVYSSWLSMSLIETSTVSTYTATLTLYPCSVPATPVTQATPANNAACEPSTTTETVYVTVTPDAIYQTVTATVEGAETRITITQYYTPTPHPTGTGYVPSGTGNVPSGTGHSPTGTGAAPTGEQRRSVDNHWAPWNLW